VAKTPTVALVTRSAQELLDWAALAVPLGVCLFAYAPAVGHGFISDDFRWIVESRLTRATDIAQLFSRNIGFYRPLVAVSFAADSALFGNHPLGFGWTNLVLALGCAFLLFELVRALNVPWPGAGLGSALWLLNFRGTQTAILWISGRTALVLVAASLGTAIALLRGRLLVAGACLLLALFSKEEAVALPFILCAWLVVLRRSSHPRPRVHPVAWLALSCLALALYALMRARSGAMTPQSAPPYYHFTFEAARVVENALQYADPTLTLSAATCLGALLLLSPLSGRIAPDASTLLCGTLWILGGYGLTLFLEVRSTLYACFPSIGASVIGAEVCVALWRRATASSQRRATVAAIVLPLALIPVFRARNRRWVDLADFSSCLLKNLEAETASVPEGSQVVLIDEDRARRVNVESAFGTLINDAYFLQSGRRLDIWVEPPLARAAQGGLERPCPSCVSLELRLRDGRLTPLETPGHGPRTPPN
jgi:hypothetical protein